MIVVSDTSPITALLSVGSADLLATLFGRVVIPIAVERELLRYHKDLPPWLEVRTLQDKIRSAEYGQLVDMGEAEAIALAEEMHADFLLIDERKGRRLAAARQLRPIGLLGVVLLAKQQGLIQEARQLLVKLEDEAGVYLSEALRESALRSIGE